VKNRVPERLKKEKGNDIASFAGIISIYDYGKYKPSVWYCEWYACFYRRRSFKAKGCTCLGQSRKGAPNQSL
jgi:hypothetical protein